MEKFTTNSSNTPVKAYTLYDVKFIFKYKNQQFSSSKKAAKFCKTLAIDKQPPSFQMRIYKSRLHFGTFLGKRST